MKRGGGKQYSNNYVQQALMSGEFSQWHDKMVLFWIKDFTSFLGLNLGSNRFCNFIFYVTKGISSLDISEGTLEKIFWHHGAFGRLMIWTPLFVKKMLSLFPVLYSLGVSGFIFQPVLFQHDLWIPETTEDKERFPFDH